MSQGNSVELGGEMVLILIALFAKYKGKDADEYPTGWEATTSFSNTIELKNRYIAAHKDYFKNIPNASQCAMMVNPILTIYGFNEIGVLLDDETADDLKCQ
eukprot:15116370-Ditylum_brightwellii.AAC.1